MSRLSVQTRMAASGLSAQSTVVYSATYDGNAYDGLINEIGTEGGTVAFTNPSGTEITVSASSILSGMGPDRCFNHDVSTSTGRYHSTDSPGQWVEVDFGADNAVRVDKSAIRNQNYPENNPVNHKVQGSNDGTSWTDLYSTTSHPDGAKQWGAYDSSDTTTEWRYLRVLSTGVDSSGANYLIIGEWEIWGDYVSL